MNLNPQNNMENTTQNGASLAPMPGSLLWEQMDEIDIKGYLAEDPGTALFLIRAQADGQVTLSGAFIPDDEDNELWQLENAKAAALAYMLEWLNTKGRAILSANTEL